MREGPFFVVGVLVGAFFAFAFVALRNFRAWAITRGDGGCGCVRPRLCWRCPPGGRAPLHDELAARREKRRA